MNRWDENTSRLWHRGMHSLPMQWQRDLWIPAVSPVGPQAVLCLFSLAVNGWVELAWHGLLTFSFKWEVKDRKFHLQNQITVMQFLAHSLFNDSLFPLCINRWFHYFVICRSKKKIKKEVPSLQDKREKCFKRLGLLNVLLTTFNWDFACTFSDGKHLDDSCQNNK